MLGLNFSGVGEPIIKIPIVPKSNIKLFRVQITTIQRITHGPEENPNKYRFEARNFRIENYTGGDYYFGQIVDSKREGYGEYNWGNGSQFCGQTYRG